LKHEERHSNTKTPKKEEDNFVQKNYYLSEPFLL